MSEFTKNEIERLSEAIIKHALGESQDIEDIRLLQKWGSWKNEQKQSQASTYNQSNKYDKGKLMYELVPTEFEEWLAEIFTFGNQKGYKPESWKTVEPDRYYAALKRHLTAWRKGEINDQESGQNHLKHVMWNVGALLYLTMDKE